jgi:3-keto-L-gulonate-6-phosphate decarboxylase
VRTVVNCRVCELAMSLELIVVTICKMFDKSNYESKLVIHTRANVITVHRRSRFLSFVGLILYYSCKNNSSILDLISYSNWKGN